MPENGEVMSNKKHYSIPNHLNKEPFLTVWWMEEPKNTLFFMQISEDEQNPVWMRYGDIVEMLSRHVNDFENTVMIDLITALKFHESISVDFVKKHLVK